MKAHSSEESSKESSPFKDILSTMERPPIPDIHDREITSPMSADYINKKSFFHNLTKKPRYVSSFYAPVA